MADFKVKYPTGANADTTAITCTLTSLASSATLVAGQASAAVDNRTTNDIDHLISGKIRMGAVAPTVNTYIEVWAAAPYKIASGTATFPDVLDGTDSAKTFTSLNVKNSSMRLIWSTLVDATANRDYFIPPTSLRNAFGEMPAMYQLFVTNGSGQALSATGTDHVLHYERVQNQSV